MVLSIIPIILFVGTLIFTLLFQGIEEARIWIIKGGIMTFLAFIFFLIIDIFISLF